MEKKDKLALFRSYMGQKRQWIKVSEFPTSATYEMHIKPQKGSCLVALVLLCFLVIPGLLYLYYTNKPASVEKIHVELLDDGSLKASGTTSGMSLYRYFATVWAIKDGINDLSEEADK